MHLKKLLALALTAPLFALAACGGSDANDDTASDPSASASSAEGGPNAGKTPGSQTAPEPDLEGIPDVVADVNGTEIGKDEFVQVYESQFQQQAQQAQMTGQEVDQDAMKKQTAEQLVSQALLTQEAETRGIEASEADVNDTLVDMAKQNNMSKKQFLAALKEQGMSEDHVQSQLETQVQLEGLIADEAGDIEATEAEMRKMYDAAKSQQGKLPPYQKVKPQLAEQVETEKRDKTAQKLEAELRKGADITIHV